jgi:nucleotide-binding universal stress UspA family protein
MLTLFEALVAWLVLVVVCMAITGYLAARWGHGPFGWLLLCAAMGPIAVIALVVTHGAEVSRLRAAPLELAAGQAAARVLIGCDGSPVGERLARYVAASHAGGHIELIAVLPYEAEPGTSARSREDARAATERMTAPAASALRAMGVDADVHAAYGHAGEQIVRRATEVAAGAIVVGRRGSGLSRALLGSTSDHVVRNATCPVTVID